VTTLIKIKKMTALYKVEVNANFVCRMYKNFYDCIKRLINIRATPTASLWTYW